MKVQTHRFTLAIVLLSIIMIFSACISKEIYKAPTLTLLGDKTVIHELNTQYYDAGVHANDVEEGDISNKVQTQGHVDTSVLGVYSLRYSVSNSEGKKAVPVIRNVLVTAPLSLNIDDALMPDIKTVKGVNDEGIRQVSAVSFDDIKANFIANELIVASDSLDAVTKFAERWNSEIIEIVKFKDTPDVYTIRIENYDIDHTGVATHLKQLGKMSYGDYKFSSDKARKLFAISIQEMAESGMTVSLNWLTMPADIAEGTTQEAATSTTDPTYIDDAFQWPYFTLDDVQASGVTSAWQLLNVLGNTRSQKITVVDGGFIDTNDYPNDTYPAGAGWGVPASVGCGGDNCRWHGTKVAHVAAALPDNNLGVAGSAGVHGRLELVQLTGGFDTRGFIRLLANALEAPLNGPPAVVNLSGTVEVPPLLNIAVNQLLDPIMSFAHRFGVLIVAAAGNAELGESATDVDQKARLLGYELPFERSTMIPCETHTVVCVGGMQWNRVSLDPGSNYGSDREADSVDIYASYEFWTPDVDRNGVPLNSNVKSSGTSYSAPFVSGVIALMRSANPNLSATDTVDCLLGSAHQDLQIHRFTGNQRRVNAFGAVNCALGSSTSYPLLRIVSPLTDSEVRGQIGLPLQAISIDSNGEKIPITWTSNIDGPITTLGSGINYNYPGLSVGEHTLSATVTGTNGESVSETVEVTVLNNPPRVTILTPRDGTSYPAGQPIRLQAISNDVDATPYGRLNDSQITWSIAEAPLYTSTGHNSQITAGQLPVGNYTLIVRANDGEDIAQQSRNFSIGECVGECPNTTIIAPGDISISTSQRDEVGIYADIQFSGIATDAEDGTFSGRLGSGPMSWRSISENGSITNICSPIIIRDTEIRCDAFTKRFYLNESGSNTEYVITLSVTDSDGNTATDTISITLSYALL